MLDDLDIDTTIRFAIYNLMLCLYDYGLEEIHMGGLMRLLGVEDQVAQKYDDEIVLLDDEFARYVQELTQTAHSAGQTLH